MDSTQTGAASSVSSPPMNFLFVEMGVGYDQHGQDITKAAMRACRDAISSNSIPAFRRGTMICVNYRLVGLRFGLRSRVVCKKNGDFEFVMCMKPHYLVQESMGMGLYQGSIPGVSFGEMKLHIKLGVSHSLQQSLDIEKVKSIFPYGKILDVEVVDGGLVCSSGVHVEEMGDKNDDCYIVNAAVYVGY
ncbi:hypothetical protein AKJ16_DCAP03220 [Drosera capensis]